MLVQNNPNNSPHGQLILVSTIVLFFFYGVIGRAIPAGFGLYEVISGSVLLIIIGSAVFDGYADFNVQPPIFPALLLSVYPSFIGLAVSGNIFTNFIRDIIPLGFLFLPIILWRNIISAPRVWRRVFEELFCFSGMGLAARHLFGAGAAFQDVAISDEVPLNQCPTVIFAAIYSLLRGISRGDVFVVRLYRLIVGIVCLASLSASVFRAQIFIVIFSVVIGIVFASSFRQIVRTVVFAFVSLVVVFLLGVDVEGPVRWTLEMMGAKTEATGGLANSRDAEANSILTQAFENPLALLLGQGWGSVMYLQTANDYVRFAHNSLMYFIWKSGFIGLGLIIYYYFSLARFDYTGRARVLFVANSPTMLGLASAGLIFGVVEMGYKMLSFGFLLCLMLAVARDVGGSSEYK